MNRFVLLICAIVFPLQMVKSADLDPLIAPHAAKHREEINKILLKAESAERLARDAYLVVLDSLERDLVAKRDPAGAALIDTERKGAAGISLGSGENDKLPKKAQGPRRTLVKELAKVQVDVVASARRPNAAYLAALNAIPGTAENPALAKQIVAEKKRLLLGVGTVVNFQTDMAGTLWRRVNNNKVLHVFTLDKKWEGSDWTAEAPDKIRFHWASGGGVTLTLAEGGNMIIGEDGKPNMILERGRAAKVAE
ncbi:hypothetical protein [Luteolibacter sp. Populi]|uniref:hypothetical protein n=1 Tax=Luteolibacter sp. Populi TaxID=3230487 RepID=UPI003464F264